ncbi:hypothetical protein [Paraburkholderia sediminicola]|uniref:hypothetical protein n=1 Tax=Paraburkholderia sediminicola TaxID=458836 RepID=UPI0038BC06A6
MKDVQQFDEAWKALGDPGLHRASEQQRSDTQAQTESSAMILIARVTVGDETLTVKATDIGAALAALNGEPKAGMRLEAKIEFDAMTRAEFASIPEYQ